MDNYLIEHLKIQVLSICTQKIRALCTEQNKMKICNSIDDINLLYMTNLKSRINYLKLAFAILTNKSTDINRFIKLEQIMAIQAKLLNISKFHYKKHLAFCTQIRKIIYNYLNLAKEKLI